MEITEPNLEDVTIINVVVREGRGNTTNQVFVPSQIPQKPTLEQLYLRDREQFFQNTSIKITLFLFFYLFIFSEILKLSKTIQKKN